MIFINDSNPRMSSLAIRARLIALLEGLGIPHAPTLLAKPVSEFYTVGQTIRNAKSVIEVQEVVQDPGLEITKEDVENDARQLRLFD